VKKTGWIERNRIRLVLPLALTVGLFSACSREPVVATVDGEDITRIQLIEEARQRGVPMQQDALQQLLVVLVDRSAAVIKAEELSLMDDLQFRQAYRNLVLETLKRRYRTAWESELEVTEAEILAEYQHQAQRYTIPEQIRISLILFETESVARQSAEQLRGLAAGESRDELFRKLAVSHSLDRASRYRGGNLGMLSNGDTSRLPKAVTAGAFALANIGELTDLIAVDDHFYLVKLDERKPAHLQALVSVQDQIKQRLLTAKMDEFRQRMQDKIREGIHINTFPKVLATITDTAPADAGNQQPPGPALN